MGCCATQTAAEEPRSFRLALSSIGDHRKPALQGESSPKPHTCTAPKS